MVPAGRHDEPEAQLSCRGAAGGQKVRQDRRAGAAPLAAADRLLAVPGSADEGHIRENLDIFDFTLDADDLATLAKANSNKRVFDVPLSAQTDMIMGFKFND